MKSSAKKNSKVFFLHGFFEELYLRGGYFVRDPFRSVLKKRENWIRASLYFSGSQPFFVKWTSSILKCVLRTPETSKYTTNLLKIGYLTFYCDVRRPPVKNLCSTSRRSRTWNFLFYITHRFALQHMEKRSSLKFCFFSFQISKPKNNILLGANETCRVQVHQRFTLSFCTNSLVPVKYKRKM